MAALFLPKLDADGRVRPPASPGLGMDVSPDQVREYLVDVDITVGGKTLYTTPDLTS